MSSYLVQAPLDEVAEWFRHTPYLAGDLRSVDAPAPDKVVARYERASGLQAELQLRLSPMGRRTLADLRVVPIGPTKMVLWVATGLWPLLAILAGVRLFAYLRSPWARSQAEGAVGLLVGVTICLLTWSSLARKLGRAEREFWRAAGAQFAIEALKMDEQAGLSPIRALLQSQLLLLFSVAGLLLLRLTTAFLVLLPVLLIRVAASFLDVLLRKDYYSRWKVGLATAVTGWTGLFLSLVYFVCMLYYVGLASAKVASAPADLEGAREAVIGGLRATFVSPADADSVVNVLSQHPQTREIAGLTVIAARLVLPLVLLGLAAVTLSQLRSLIGRPERWMQTIDPSGRAGGASLPPAIATSRAGLLAAQVTIWVLFAVVSLESLLGVFLVTNILAYLLAGWRFSEVMSHLLSWLFVTPPPGLGVPLDFRLLDKLYAAGLLALCLPLIVIALLRGLSIVRAFSRWRRASQPVELPRPVQDMVRSVCSTWRIAVPRVAQEPEGPPGVFSYWPTLGAPRIGISTGALSALTDGELQAAIAHELGHLVLHWPRCRRLRAWSNLTLFCPNLLLLTMDFSEAELDADQFAVARLRDRTALRSAIVKLSLLGSETGADDATSRRKGFWQRAREGFRLLHRFFFQPGLLGQTYPPMALRLQRLEEQQA